MPLDTKPEDKPAAVLFHLSPGDGAFAVTSTNLPQKRDPPFRIMGGVLDFDNRDAFKARAVQVGLTPAVAEEEGRSFNATARQLRELGFEVELEEEKEEEEKAA
ncbi:MAG: hypothetical protein WA476_20400 [Acidobacteriaceae bacterium]